MQQGVILFRLLGRVWFFFTLASSVFAGTIFQDGFESGRLGPSWSVSTTEDGRATVTTNFAPASGQFQLVLDDAVDDAIYSVTEATLHLDVSNKKNVKLSFNAKSLGNEPDYPPFGIFSTFREFDGVSLSVDGGNTWLVVASLATVDVNWAYNSITLDDIMPYGWEFGPDFRIRFSEYDNASAPLDGIAIDDVLVTADDDQRAVLELPSPLVEGTGPYTGYVLLAFAPTNTLQLALSANPTNQLNLPATVNVPAGHTYAPFTFSVLNNNVVDLARSVTVYPSAPGVDSSGANIVILDDDIPVVALTLPAQLFEGDHPSSNAVISLDRAPVVPLTMSLTASPADQLTLPYWVTIPAGQTQAVFTVLAYDDTSIDGNVPVTVTASYPGIVSATAQTVAVDNETRTLSFSLPATILEGSTVTGSVQIPGTLPTNLDVTLVSSNTAALTVPTTVTIVAGETSASFSLVAVDNAVRDGSRQIGLTASAPTFTKAGGSIIVRDNEIAAYTFGPLSGIVNVGSPLNITVQAVDIEGNIIGNTAASVNLFVVLPDGSTQPLAPTSASWSGAAGWSGTVTIPGVAAAPLRLRATDASGNTGDSNPFDIMRVLNLTAADLAWDSFRNRIYASVPAAAADANANRVLSIDPATAQIAGSVVTAQDPGRLVLTSGGEYLYAALNANGTVCKITPTNMAVASTFAVGVDPNFGTLYVEDMCAIAGQPNTLVISQMRTTADPEHNGVAVYDNGVSRPTKLLYDEDDLIEPSADPSIFFGYNTENSESGFRKLQVSASGIAEIAVNTSILGYASDIRSDGNTVFSTSGVEIDGTQLRRLGSFPVTGPVCPDLPLNRVYFIQPVDSYYYSTASDKIGAYDPATFSLICKLTLPAPVNSPASFIRWGTNGLAFRAGTNVYLVNSSQLIPNAAPANLGVKIQATPNPATVLAPLTYTVCVSNQGPSIARSATVSVTLSAGQTILNTAASQGTPVVTSNTVVTLVVGDFAAGAAAKVILTTQPQAAGVFSCTATVSSQSADPDFADNSASKWISAGLQAKIDACRQFPIQANNVVYDSGRNLLWASIPAGSPASLGRSLVAIDPVSGSISDPIPLNGTPQAGCMVLSTNGRYLYVGLSDIPEVSRLDLTLNPPVNLQIPMGLNQWNEAGYAEDIVPLDGDGTSFLVTTFGDDGAAVFDGLVRRGNRSGIYTVDRIERTGTPGVFIGVDTSDSGYAASSLSVASTGVTITHSIWSLLGGGSYDISGAGGLVLSSQGILADSTNLVVKANYGVSGAPCLDLPNQRAYILNGGNLLGFDTSSALPVGTFNLPLAVSGNGRSICIRWGLDGFAILDSAGTINIARWSSTIPPTLDANNDKLPDAWEAAWFGTLNVNPAADADGDGIPNWLEYLYGASPVQASPNPMRLSITNSAGQMMLRLVFPRRAGLSPEPYGYETSSDLVNWMSGTNVIENVLSTQIVTGVQLETVEALVPATNAIRGFVRLKWLSQ